MSKRFSATEIWAEDWFLDMPNDYKLFWFYMLSSCNHAGLFRVNLKSFCTLNEVKIIPQTALNLYNKGKIRIREVGLALWLIEDFFVYQYGTTFNRNNRVHDSIEKEYKKCGIELTSIRGLKDLKEGVKDKDKDKDTIVVTESETKKIEIPPTFSKFYDSELELNSDKPQIEGYKTMLEWMYKKDSVGDYQMKNVLKINKQISYENFVELKKIEGMFGTSLKKTLESLENKSGKDKNGKMYASVYLTMRAWLKPLKNEQ